MKEKNRSASEKKLAVQRIVNHCRKLAQDYVNGWTPENPSWETIEGCAYLRLSTDEQVTVEKGSLEQQVNIAISEAVARSQQHRINYKVTRFYIEPGITGRSDSRPEFDAMKEAIGRGSHKFVIFKEVARIARESTIWKAFFNLCIEKGCEVVIRGFPVNPNDPGQLLQLDIFAAFAEYESNLISKRVRETNFSALVSSGKLNSTHKVLGLDQRVVGGEPQVGFYVPNTEELKTVEWVMRTFLRYGSYQKVLEECERYGIKNKNGNPFLRHSLLTLLTNKKYIGKWEVNSENRGKNQSRLLAYDRYQEIDLPHGCVIDIDLWNKVQALVVKIAGNKDKNTQIKRVYPLTGLLRLNDGSEFHGTGAWGEHSRVNYYYNKKHGIRLSADAVEAEVKRIVTKLIQDTPDLTEAIRKRAAEVKTASDLLQSEIGRIRSARELLASERQALNKRLDFLLTDSTPAAAQDFKSEYQREMNRIAAETDRLNGQIALLERKKQQVDADAFDWKTVGLKARQLLDTIQDRDPVALKAALRSLFEEVRVGDLEAGGHRVLEFVLKNKNAGASTVMSEETSSVVEKMG